MVETKGIRKFIFGKVTDLNFSFENVEVFDASFCPTYFREDVDGYNCEDDYVTLYFKDMGLYITVDLEISYSFHEEYDHGDYFTPPYAEVVWEELDLHGEISYVIDSNDNELSLDCGEKDVYNKLVKLIEDYIYQNL